MPAVQLEKLKNEIAGLLASAGDPEQFSGQLHALLDQYANRTYRATQNVRLLVPQYHVPPLALNQLELALGSFGRDNPEVAIRLADRLWLDNFLEPRSLAASLIGRLPESYSSQIVERLRKWCTPAEDRLIVDAMLARGSTTLRSQAPEKWLSLAESWLQTEGTEYKILGLRALVLLVKDEQFENLPGVYSLAAALLRSPTGNLQGELTNLLQALSRRSPSETAYFLRQVVTSSDDPAVSRIARRCLPLLSSAAQASLRPLLKDRQR